MWILFQKGGPSYLVDPIASKLGTAKYDPKRNDYYVDCDDKTLGNMEFTFGKFKVVLTPADYIWKSGVSTTVQCACSRNVVKKPNFDGIYFFIFFFLLKNECSLNIQQLNNLPTLLLGDPFLRKVTLLLDQENDHAGLARPTA